LFLSFPRLAQAPACAFHYKASAFFSFANLPPAFTNPQSNNFKGSEKQYWLSPQPMKGYLLQFKIPRLAKERPLTFKSCQAKYF
jgi:hypothetical protein